MAGRLEEMEVFVQIYESGGLSAAAGVSGQNPSGVSRSLKQLEKRLGVLLFYRNSRRVRPTPEGDIFYRHCMHVFKTLANAESAVGAGADRSGVLRVNTLPTFAKYQLARLMPEFHERYPLLRVEFILGAQPTDLLQQRIDVAVYVGIQLDSSLIARRLTTTKWMLVASPDYLARHGTPRHPQELSRHRCLNFTFSTPWNTWRFLPPNRGLTSPKGVMAADQGDMLHELAITGMGIARLADFHTQEALAGGRLVSVLEGQLDEPDEPIYLLYRAGALRSPRIATWADFMKEKFGVTPPWRNAGASPA
ncbi:LysR family transcriptional regulator [Alcaligenaceae bacterium]|nr:LysR family transcriptional regulator [Alcaligenaceae bacterium]